MTQIDNLQYRENGLDTDRLIFQSGAQTVAVDNPVISGDLTIGGNTTVSGTLDVDGEIAFNGTIAAENLPAGVLPTTSSTPGTDFNSLTAPGWQPGIYLGTNSNGPGDANYYWVQCLVYSGGNVTQIAYHYAYPAKSIMMRGLYSGTWSSWIKLLVNGDAASFQSVGLTNGKATINSTNGYGTVTTFSNGSTNGALIGYDDNTSIYGRVGYSGYAFYGVGPSSFNGSISTISFQINDGLQQFGTIIGDSSKYMRWNKTNGTQRGYLGYGSSDETFHIYNGGPVKIIAGNSSTVDFSVGGQSTFSHSMTVLGTDSGQYAITATAGAGSGAVLGYTNDRTKYGILGYNNTHSFYGVGILYNSGNISVDTDVLVGGGIRLVGGGHIYSADGSALLQQSGAIYGTAWGGYLSTWVTNQAASQGSAYAQAYTAGRGAGDYGSYAFMRYGGPYGPNSTVAGASLFYSSSASAIGSSASGSWRSMGQGTAGTASVWLRYA